MHSLFFHIYKVLLLGLFFHSADADEEPTPVPIVPFNAQIAFRDYYDGAPEWDIIANCVSNYTDVRAIIDRHYNDSDAGVSIWLDTGSNRAADIDDMLNTNITRCIMDKTNAMFVEVRDHNIFAMRANTDEDYYNHFDIFGHGYPLDYDKDYESYGEPESNTSVSTQLSVRGDGNWPDNYFISRLYNLSLIHI